MDTTESSCFFLSFSLSFFPSLSISLLLSPSLSFSLSLVLSFFLSLSLSLLFLPPDDRHQRIELLRNVILLRRFLRDRNLRRPLRLALAGRGVRVTRVKAIFSCSEHIQREEVQRRGLPMKVYEGRRGKHARVCVCVCVCVWRG